MNTSNNTLNGTTTYIITIYSSKHNSTSFEMDLTPQRFLSFTSDNEFTRCDYINITVDDPALIAQGLTRPTNPYHGGYNTPLPLSEFLKSDYFWYEPESS